ncbi:MAG: lipocalin-like domain-containing protein [Pseudomonadota bacterium]
MNVRWLFIVFALLTSPAFPQGFGGLGSEAEGFAVPERGTPLVFPRDHGAHLDHRIEWWYLTSNLTGSDGKTYGLQWTLFRSALAPEEGEGWSSPQLWMGHAGLTTPDAHYVAERRARGGTGQAGVTAAPFEAWIDDWSMKANGAGIGTLALSASGTDFSYDLSLNAQGPLVFHGDNGYSVKSAAGQASWYYSQPFYEVRGTLRLPGGDVEVSGKAWLDREWSSQPLAADQNGWDWISLHLDDGTKVMGFRLRGTEDFTSGSWIAPDGTLTPLAPGDVTMTALDMTRVANRDVPTTWRVEIASRRLDVTIKAVNGDAWMETSVPYWEGPVTVTGSTRGIGYLEMTGY